MRQLAIVALTAAATGAAFYGWHWMTSECDRCGEGKPSIAAHDEDERSQPEPAQNAQKPKNPPATPPVYSTPTSPFVPENALGAGERVDVLPERVNPELLENVKRAFGVEKFMRKVEITDEIPESAPAVETAGQGEPTEPAKSKRAVVMPRCEDRLLRIPYAEETEGEEQPPESTAASELRAAESVLSPTVDWLSRLSREVIRLNWLRGVLSGPLHLPFHMAPNAENSSRRAFYYYSF